MTVKLNIPVKEAASMISDIFWDDYDDCDDNDKIKFLMNISSWIIEYDDEFVSELAKNIYLDGEEEMISKYLQFGKKYKNIEGLIDAILVNERCNNEVINKIESLEKHIHRLYEKVVLKK